MNVTKVISGSIKKEAELSKICQEFNVSKKELAYIGDDVNDFNLLQLVGFSAVPNDANENIKKNVDYVCVKNGGNGAFREIGDIIFKEKFPNRVKMY